MISNGSICVFILGQGDVSPDVMFILHCQLSSLHLLLSYGLILSFSLCLEGRIYIFLKEIEHKPILHDALFSHLDCTVFYFQDANIHWEFILKATDLCHVLISAHLNLLN